MACQNTTWEWSSPNTTCLWQLSKQFLIERQRAIFTHCSPSIFLPHNYSASFTFHAFTHDFPAVQELTHLPGACTQISFVQIMPYLGIHFNVRQSFSCLPAGPFSTSNNSYWSSCRYRLISDAVMISTDTPFLLPLSLIDISLLASFPTLEGYSKSTSSRFWSIHQNMEKPFRFQKKERGRMLPPSVQYNHITDSLSENYEPFFGGCNYLYSILIFLE